jgi:hypothetical protein
MRHGPIARRRLLAAAGLLLAQVATAATAGAPTLDAGRPRWSVLEYAASKLLLSATARVEAAIRPAVAVSGSLRTTPEGRPLPPGTDVLELTLAANTFGRESLTSLWADPVTGATLQRLQRDAGSRTRERVYRFTDVGAYHYTRWPADAREADLPPERWSSAAEGMRAWSAAARGQPVTEASVLLWTVGAAALDRPGDRLEALTFSRRQVNRVTIEVTGRRLVAVDYLERGPAGSRQRRESTEALVLRLSGTPLEASPGDEEFELLGLRGDLEMLLDPQSRALLELRGRVKIAGQVTVRLKRITLK